MSTAIHLTRANGFGPLPALLEARAGERAVLGAFQAEGIPFAVVDALETPIPLRAMVGLLDRAAHVDAVVRPALERGAWVVQDRTFYSTAAYQGPRGCDVDGTAGLWSAQSDWVAEHDH